MKKLMLTIILFLAGYPLTSQDYIYTKDNLEITAKVLKITESEVVYTYFNERDTLRSIPISEIYKLKYENGEYEKFENLNNLYENFFQVNAAMGMTTFMGAQVQIPIIDENLYIKGGIGTLFPLGYSYKVGLKSYPASNAFFLDFTYSNLSVDAIISKEQDFSVYSGMCGVDLLLIGDNTSGFGINAGIGLAYFIGINNTPDILLPDFDLGLFYRFK
jgi:hypothetical protein